MLKRSLLNVKKHIKELHSEDSGMELIQAVILILVAVVIGVLVMNFGKGLFNKTEGQINNSFTF